MACLLLKIACSLIISSSTPLTACGECPVGKNGTDSQSASAHTYESVACTACAAGKYSDRLKSLKCKDCRAGRYNARRNATKLSDCVGCATGRYSERPARTNSSQCISCAKGRFGTICGGGCHVAADCEVLACLLLKIAC